jgi:asparagine synthase (glutamine-hydrolysing)
MCGIVGAVTPNKLLSAGRKRSALSLIEHRGPDAEGEFQDVSSGVWLGHRRLSILDLSDTAKQPMASADGELVITFNGEIYNYRQIKQELESIGQQFQSNSDTEVLLEAWSQWGKDCLSKLIGMFAFAIWEKATGNIYLCRDRAGEKPLYYTHQGKSFYFSSEIPALKSLLDNSFELDPAGIQSYLNHGFISDELTAWKGISKLTPGHFLTFNGKSQKVEIESYRKAEIDQIQPRSTDPVSELDALLGKVVQDQLIADVPIGLMLSGGLDSSLLASYITEFSQEVNAFTVVFPGYSKLNESKFSKEICHHFHLNHQEIPCDQIQFSDWLGIMEKVEAPISDPAFYPTYLMSKAIRSHCKVALGGDGADEVFGGYERYSDLISLKNRANSIPFFLRNAVGKTAANFMPIGAKGRHKLMEFGEKMRESPPNVPPLFLDTELPKLLKPECAGWIKNSQVKEKAETERSESWIDQLLKKDFETYLPDNILTKVDRASMLASLEVRAPFLDKRVLDFAESLSPTWKVNETERKIILRKLAERRLPQNWNTGRKQGFVPPLDHWLKEKEWKGLIEEYLMGANSYFQKDFIHSLLKGQEKGRFNKRRIYALLVLAIYLKSNKA